MYILVNGKEADLNGLLIDRLYIDGGAGNDLLVFATAGFIHLDRYQRPVTMLGGEGDDYLSSTSAGDDLIDGGDGNDYLYGWQGRDTFLGGAGDDIIRYARPEATTLGGPGENVIWSPTPSGWDYRTVPGTDGTGIVEDEGPIDALPTFFTDDGADGSTDGSGDDDPTPDGEDPASVVVPPPSPLVPAEASTAPSPFAGDTGSWWGDWRDPWDEAGEAA
jgi:Ca2+-binding RTX toxin-like protein